MTDYYIVCTVCDIPYESRRNFLEPEKPDMWFPVCKHRGKDKSFDILYDKDLDERRRYRG